MMLHATRGENGLEMVIERTVEGAMKREDELGREPAFPE
ncbi:MAG: hypothetical protein AOA65_0624 [Candidatus Bathyarchaeota archaeon BA1]|nr:MAG: hypothetical protein AOA65_0624 [Candidatus Bathyarchaeota archaeon BA1]